MSRKKEIIHIVGDILIYMSHCVSSSNRVKLSRETRLDAEACNLYPNIFVSRKMYLYNIHTHAYI